MRAKIILAVDTSTAAASFAIAQNRRLLASLISHHPAPHSQTFFGNLQTLLTQAGLSLAQIDLFAGVTGPGSFTGLRVGLSALKGLAQAAARPVLGINALDLTALSAGFTGEFIVLLEAGRHEVFAGKRLVNHAGAVLQTRPDWVGPLAALAERFQSDTAAAIIGSGTVRYLANTDLAKRIVPLASPLVHTLALHAEVLLANGAPLELHPYYLRPSDAEIKFVAN